jgi:prophage antirepressor-like protein
MNEIFNFHGQEVRTVTVDNEPYFVGKDVAEGLGMQKLEMLLLLMLRKKIKGTPQFRAPLAELKK